MSRLEAALAALDAIHAEDPERVEVEGARVPAELDYARRMSAAIERVIDAPSDALRLAARAQHLARWRLARADYPATRAGYLAWRSAQGKAHAALAVATLRPLGVDEATLERVASLVQKKGRARDPEAQALEDAACLVFLDTGLAAFARGKDEGKVIDIVQKTWAKMSERGRAEALALSLAPEARAIVERALS
ncbi:MAG: DUF4202 domain-containing protein [Sandaracinaceae bacterium]|nr:DUF4202 domain-containing protein [Sandaracinaceae bacterium]